MLSFSRINLKLFQFLPLTYKEKKEEEEEENAAQKRRESLSRAQKVLPLLRNERTPPNLVACIFMRPRMRILTDNSTYLTRTKKMTFYLFLSFVMKREDDTKKNQKRDAKKKKEKKEKEKGEQKARTPRSGESF